MVVHHDFHKIIIIIIIVVGINVDYNLKYFLSSKSLKTLKTGEIMLQIQKLENGILLYNKLLFSSLKHRSTCSAQ